MSEAESYYNAKVSLYDEVFGILYFEIFDAVARKYLEPYVPTRPEDQMHWRLRLTFRQLHVKLDRRVERSA